MTARVLVVDDTEANVRLLQAKLANEYYTVVTASDGVEAIQKAHDTAPDVILLDVMMPNMDGFEACRRLKADPETCHIPIVMVTALSEREDRLRGLREGADDFLTKPVNEFAVLARVRALTRFKSVADELRKREANGRDLGVIDGFVGAERGVGARILIVDDNERQANRLAKALESEHFPITLASAGGLAGASGVKLDAILLSLVSERFDGLRLLAHFRSDAASRDIPIIAFGDTSEEARLVRALELGASDILTRPIDHEELAARMRTQIRRKRYVDALRNRLDQSLELAVTDQLTGLHNRRYMLKHFGQHLRRASMGGAPCSVMICDIDHFKKVNDTFGHDVGDEVLKEFATRMATHIRPNDLGCRFGGEEFVVLMPETEAAKAFHVAERLRASIDGAPFRLKKRDETLAVTISVGVATSQAGEEDVDAILKRADEALYRAKAGGRNRVQSDRDGAYENGADGAVDAA